MTKRQAHQMFTSAKKQFTGKTCRAMGKYTGVVQEVFEHYTRGFVALVKCADGREVMTMPDELEIEMERITVLGYTIDSATLMSIEEKA